MTDLTTNFSLEELSSYGFAKLHGISLPDSIPEIVINELQITANLLQLSRDRAGIYFKKEVGITITNAWRWKELNDRVGSHDNSAHFWGGAADMVPRGVSLEDFFNWWSEDLVLMAETDQLIAERGCVHIGRSKSPKQPRRELRGEAWVKQPNGKMERHYPLIKVVEV